MFQVYKTFTKTVAYTTISIEEYIDAIKNNKFNSKQITELRSLDKTTNNKRYKELKSSCNSVTINFLFKGVKNNKNIIGSTGFLYLDIDDKSFDINQLNINDIVCCHKSCGGLGWSIIVRVNGLTLNNYSSTVELISKEMGLEKFIDKGANKATQYLVISNDKDIIVNPTPKIWDATLVNEVKPEYSNIELKECITTKSRTKSNKNTYNAKLHLFKEEIDFNNLTGDVQWINNELVDICSGEVITEKELRTTRLNNLDDYDIDGLDFQLFKEKIDIVEIYLPYNNKTKTIKPIPPGKRHVFMNGICQNFLWLNQWISEIRLIEWLKSINDICNCCMEEKEIRSIVRYYFNLLKEGKLTPNYNKKRRCTFNKNSKLNKEEKLLIVNKEIGKFRSENTLDSILLAIEELKQKGLKPTQKNVAELTKKCLRTIKSYWNKIKNT